MWKTFQQNDNLYMIKVLQSESLRLHLTDFQNIWTQNITKDAVLEQFQELNPLFDIKIDEAVSEVIKLIDNIADIQDLNITENGSDLHFTVKYTKSKLDVHFKFIFEKLTLDSFLKEVTVPLVQTVKHLEERQNMLCNLIQKKDRELEEYKLEKGLISRDDLITEKFDETMMAPINDESSMMNVFGRSESFWENFVARHGKIETKIEEVKKDPWNHIKRKRKVYSSKTAIKKGKGINYDM